MSDLRDSTGIVANDGMVGSDGGVGLDLSGWPLRLNIAADVAKGMAYLHGEGIFHRDLTSKNVLVRVSTDTTGGYTFRTIHSSLTTYLVRYVNFSYAYACFITSPHNLQKKERITIMTFRYSRFLTDQLHEHTHNLTAPECPIKG